MTLYHFTARHLAERIRVDGLTKGMIPVSLSPPTVHAGYQWLTLNPGAGQEWAEGTGRLPYRRDEVRFRVEIPSDREGLLLKREQWSRLMDPGLARDLCAFGDPDNWLVYCGNVPPEWISLDRAYTEEVKP